MEGTCDAGHDSVIHETAGLARALVRLRFSPRSRQVLPVLSEACAEESAHRLPVAPMVLIPGGRREFDYGTRDGSTASPRAPVHRRGRRRLKCPLLYPIPALNPNSTGLGNRSRREYTSDYPVRTPIGYSGPGSPGSRGDAPWPLRYP